MRRRGRRAGAAVGGARAARRGGRPLMTARAAQQSRRVEIGMTGDELLGFINKVAANLYRDPALNLLGVAEKVKMLINAHVSARGVDPKIPPTMNVSKLAPIATKSLGYRILDDPCTRRRPKRESRITRETSPSGR